MGAYSYEGPSMAEEKTAKPFDHHCPLMASGSDRNGDPNYWLANCQERQRQPANKGTCYPHCKAGASLAHKQVSAAWVGRAGELRRKILDMVGRGLSRVEIAEQLGISPASVSRHKYELKQRGLLLHDDRCSVA